MRIAIVVPAYNEEEAITGVVNGINALNLEKGLHIDVVVVNDCSTDNTLNVVSCLNCTVLNLPVNLGIGGAMQTGFKYAYQQGYDAAIQVDGDGQHPAEQITLLIDAHKKNNWDVVIGSRFIAGKGFQSTVFRRQGIRYFMFLNKLLTGYLITDPTSGFRLLNRKALEIVNEYYPDEYPEPEAIVLFSKHNLHIGEVPVQMRERQGGVSSITTSSSVYYMFKVTLAMLFTYIRN